MAVYTQLGAADLKAFLADFDLGELEAFEGIEGGVENTNYFVDTRSGETRSGDTRSGETRDGDRRHRFVLTLFEELPFDEMPFFVELTGYLAARQVPVPAPLKDRYGIALKTLARRPALLLPRFEGSSIAHPGPDHCAQIGQALARLHQAGSDFFMNRQAHRGVFWWRRESRNVAAHLSAEDASLLAQEVVLFDRLREQPLNLPMGIIHGDLFHDNALFHQGKLSAIIDLYNACTGYLLYDLAIVANDWCVTEAGAFDAPRLEALLSAYAAVRPFTDSERQAWPVLIRTAAMRFWLSRLSSLHALEPTRHGGAQVVKDPDELKRILLNHIEHPGRLP